MNPKSHLEPQSVRTVAHYNLLDRMGESAIGYVYRARDTKAGRTVAVKLAPGTLFPDATSRSNFLQDARAAAALSHPNIATLFDMGEHEDGFYLAYEYAFGVTLRQETAGGAVSPRRAVELASQLADALAYAHAHGVLHGDLRPDTILVTNKGSAKILEFGMAYWTRGGQARIQVAERPEAVTENASTTVSYMSPEQAGGGTVDARTDVFSLGVILYEMLNGRNPLAAPTAAETLTNVLSHSPLPLLPDTTLPPPLPAVLARGVHKNVEHRFQSAASFSAELRRVGAVLDERAGESGPRELLIDEETAGSGKWWAIAAGAALLAAVGWWIF